MAQKVNSTSFSGKASNKGQHRSDVGSVGKLLAKK